MKNPVKVACTSIVACIRLGKSLLQRLPDLYKRLCHRNDLGIRGLFRVCPSFVCALQVISICVSLEYIDDGGKGNRLIDSSVSFIACGLSPKALHVMSDYGSEKQAALLPQKFKQMVLALGIDAHLLRCHLGDNNEILGPTLLFSRFNIFANCDYYARAFGKVKCSHHLGQPPLRPPDSATVFRNGDALHCLHSPDCLQLSKVPHHRHVPALRTPFTPSICFLHSFRQ